MRSVIKGRTIRRTILIREEEDNAIREVQANAIRSMNRSISYSEVVNALVFYSLNKKNDPFIDFFIKTEEKKDKKSR